VSHYARLVSVVNATAPSGAAIELAPGTEIRAVLLTDIGVYIFRARRAGRWLSCSTEQDLPAATDRGRAERAKRATLRPGRPIRAAAPSTKRLVCKVTEGELERVKRDAAEENRPDLSAHIRARLGLND
jgi:hypothetical protein